MKKYKANGNQEEEMLICETSCLRISTNGTAVRQLNTIQARKHQHLAHKCNVYLEL